MTKSNTKIEDTVYYIIFLPDSNDLHKTGLGRILAEKKDKDEAIQYAEDVLCEEHEAAGMYGYEEMEVILCQYNETTDEEVLSKIKLSWVGERPEDDDEHSTWNKLHTGVR